MTKLVCVPDEITDEMCNAWKARDRWKDAYKAMLAAAPPLPPDIEEALELAKKVLADLGSDDEHIQLARALLKSHGRE